MLFIIDYIFSWIIIAVYDHRHQIIPNFVCLDFNGVGFFKLIWNLEF